MCHSTMLKLPKLRQNKRFKRSKKNEDEDFDSKYYVPLFVLQLLWALVLLINEQVLTTLTGYLGDEFLSQDECQTLDPLLTKQQVYYSTNYPLPKRNSGIDLPTPTGPFSVESIINYRPPAPSSNIDTGMTKTSNTNYENTKNKSSNNVINYGNHARESGTTRKNMRYSWNFFTPTHVVDLPEPVSRQCSELVRPTSQTYDMTQSAIPSKMTRLQYQTQSQKVNQPESFAPAQKQTFQPPIELSLSKGSSPDQPVPPNTNFLSSATKKYQQRAAATDLAPLNSAIFCTGSTNIGQRDDLTIDKNANGTGANTNNSAPTYKVEKTSTEAASNCIAKNFLHHQPRQLRQESENHPNRSTASEQSQLTNKSQREPAYAHGNGHSRTNSAFSVSSFQSSCSAHKYLNISQNSLNNTNNNNFNHGSPDQRSTHSNNYRFNSSGFLDHDSNSFISLYFDTLEVDHDQQQQQQQQQQSITKYKKMQPEVELNNPLPRASPTDSLAGSMSDSLLLAHSLTDSSFSEPATPNTIYSQPFLESGPNTKYDNCTFDADIFERSVQKHQQQPKMQQKQEGLIVNSIPLHLFNDDYIPAVLQASTEALTECGLDPDSIDVLSRRRPSSLRSFSFSGTSVAGVTPVVLSHPNYRPGSVEKIASSDEPVAEPLVVSKKKTQMSTCKAAQQQQQQQRVLSFCSFADLVSSEQPDIYDTFNGSNNNFNCNSNNSYNWKSESNDVKNDGDILPYPPFSGLGARSRRSSVFSDTTDDDVKVASLRQVIRRNSEIISIH